MPDALHSRPPCKSFTALGNQRSRALMVRLGMRGAADFEHLARPPGHALRPHALYRLRREGDAASRILGA